MNDYTNTKRIVIIPTRRCNLRCNYCQVDKQERDMDEKTISSLVNFIKSSNFKNLEIQFSGGEPLITFDIVEKIVNSLKEFGKEIKYIITTNGVLLNDKILKFVKKNKINLSISIDGLKESHNLNRVFLDGRGSYDSISYSINKLKALSLEFHSEMVITPQTSSSLFNNLIQLETLGCRGVFLMPVCGDKWEKEDLQVLKNELKKYSQYYLKDNRSLEILNLKNKDECHKFNTELTIDFDGKVYTGNGFLVNPKIKEVFYIGNVRTNTFNEVVIRIKSENEVAKIIFPKEVVDSFKQAGHIIEDFCEIVLKNLEVRYYDSLLKKISIYSHLTGSDMPYPPINLWKKLDRNKQIDSWKKTISQINTNPEVNKLGLYLHVPFCEKKCFFCMCKSTTIPHGGEIENYINLLKEEIYLIKELFNEMKFDSLYIGGGTPSLLSSKELRILMSLIHDNFSFKESIQKAIEINPGSMNSQKWSILKEYGINRVTIGVQTADEDLAKKLNRPQKQFQIVEAVKLARENGIKIINIDLIAGLPNQSEESFVKSIKFAISLKPDLIHINPFSPTKDTLFYKSKGNYNFQEIIQKEKLGVIGRKIVEDSGHISFLNEKEKIKEKQLRHLQDYNSLEEKYSILGLGAGSISHAHGKVHYTKLDYKDYKSSLINKQLPNILGYIMSEEEEARGYIINSLEEEGGLDIKKFKLLFKKDFEREFKSTIDFLIKTQKAKFDGNKFKIISKKKIDRVAFSKYFFSKKILDESKKIVAYLDYPNLDLELRKLI